MLIHTIEYDIDWDNFKPYSSFFIPALNWRYAKDLVREECAKRGLLVIVRLAIENDVRGIRVWRVYKRGEDPAYGGNDTN